MTLPTNVVKPSTRIESGALRHHFLEGVRVADLVDPPLFREFPFNVWVRFLAPSNIRPTSEQRDSYRRFTRMGDPLADDLVAAFRRLPAGVGAPSSRPLSNTGSARWRFRCPNSSPSSAMLRTRRTGWTTRRSTTPSGSRRGWACSPALTALSMFSLMGGYLASRADKTLVATGDLEAMAPRRLAETLNWVVDVTAPDALQRFGRGFTSTLRVRLMHAMVRAGMARRPDWDFEDWDHPVNQSTMAGTLMLFSLGNVLGSQALGVQFSRQDKDALYHFWRYVGFLLGLDPRIATRRRSRHLAAAVAAGRLRVPAGRGLPPPRPGAEVRTRPVGDRRQPAPSRPRSVGQSRPKSSAPTAG